MIAWFRSIVALGLALILRGPARVAPLPPRWLWRVTWNGGATWRYEYADR